MCLDWRSAAFWQMAPCFCKYQNNANANLMVFCLPICWIVSHSAIQKIFTFSNKIIYRKSKGEIVQKDLKIKQNKTKQTSKEMLIPVWTLSNFQELLNLNREHYMRIKKNATTPILMWTNQKLPTERKIHFIFSLSLSLPHLSIYTGTHFYRYIYLKISLCTYIWKITITLRV